LAGACQSKIGAQPFYVAARSNRDVLNRCFTYTKRPKKSGGSWAGRLQQDTKSLSGKRRTVDGNGAYFLSGSLESSGLIERTVVAPQNTQS
jgi:hypothetical protein